MNLLMSSSVGRESLLIGTWAPAGGETIEDRSCVMNHNQPLRRKVCVCVNAEVGGCVCELGE